MRIVKEWFLEEAGDRYLILLDGRLGADRRSRARIRQRGLEGCLYDIRERDHQLELTRVDHTLRAIQ